MRYLLWILLQFLFLSPSLSSFCGTSGVPFSFEVLPSGAPVLGCAQPSCVANPDDKNDSNFLVNADGQTDGFMREGDKDTQRKDRYPKLVANCSGKFSDLSCPRKDQWVGGIEYIDHPRQPLILQCCTFAGLRFSQDVGVTNVGPGEAITGGEVIRDGRQISFDVIANARKVVDANTHIVSYEVTVRRMNCLPDPPETVVQFEKGVTEEVVKVLTKANSHKRLPKEQKKESENDNIHSEKAFGVQIQKIDEKKQKKKQPVEVEHTEKNDKVVDNQEVNKEQTVAMHGNQNELAPQRENTHRNQNMVQRHEIHAGGQPVLQVNERSPSESGTFSDLSERSPSASSSLPYPADIERELQEGQQQPFNGPINAQQQVNAPSATAPAQIFGPGLRLPVQGAGPAYQGIVPSRGFVVPQGQPFAPQSFRSGYQQGQQIQQPYPVGIPPYANYPVYPNYYGNGLPCPQGCNPMNSCQRCDPIFGLPSLPTLPPHTFPTLPPHTFPTFPPHTFPTLATLPPHTFPTLMPPVGLGYAAYSPPPTLAALGARTYTENNASPLDVSGARGTDGGLTPFTTAAPLTTFPPAFLTPPPIVSFEEFLQRLGFANGTFPTMAPFTFTPYTTPQPPSTTASQPIIQNMDVAVSQESNQQQSGPVFYASQPWVGSPGQSFTMDNAIPRAHATQ